jgi:hypothetical protein
MSLVNAADVASQILMCDRQKGISEMMKKFIYGILASIVLYARAQAGSVLFDFNDPNLRHTPLPIDLTVAGLTAHLSGTGDNFSIQQLGIDTNNIIPAGFTGNCVYPNGVATGDLLVGFSQTLTDFSIMVAPDELNTDSTATLILLCHLGRDTFRHAHEFTQHQFLGCLVAEPVADPAMHLWQGDATPVRPRGKKPAGAVPGGFASAVRGTPATPGSYRPASR